MRLLVNLFSLSLTMFCLFSCSNSNNIAPIYFDGISIKEEYAKGFYESFKNEFIVFDNNDDLIDYLRDDKFNVKDSFYEECNNILDKEFYTKSYVVFFNIVIGTSDRVKIYQKNNQILYNVISSNPSTDGLNLQTIIHSVKKYDLSTSDFEYIVK